MDGGPDPPRDARPLAAVDDALAWAMVEAAPDGMILTDEQGVILVVSGALEALLGYDRVELLGRPIEVLLPERDRPVHSAHRIRFRAEPEPRPMGRGRELWARASDGSELPVEVSLSPVCRDGVTLVVATVRDATQRRVQAAHRARVEAMAGAAPYGVLLVRADTLAITWSNRAAAGFLGYDRAELAAMTPLHVLPDLTETELRRHLGPVVVPHRDDPDRSAREVGSVRLTTSVRTRAGRDRRVELVIEAPVPPGPAGSAPPSPAPGGPDVVLVVTIHDLADEVRVEALADELARAEARLDHVRRLHQVIVERLYAAGLGLQHLARVEEGAGAKGVLDQVVVDLDRVMGEVQALYGPGPVADDGGTGPDARGDHAQLGRSGTMPLGPEHDPA